MPDETPGKPQEIDVCVPAQAADQAGGDNTAGGLSGQAPDVEKEECLPGPTK